MRPAGTDDTDLPWETIWAGLGCPPPEGLRDTLLAAYRESHRAYHTVAHLRAVFAALADVAPIARRLPELQVALWFHDAVYDPRAADNEERSARWAADALCAAGAAPEVAERVAALVRATRHDAVPDDPDARLLVDADLAILGADPDTFDRYEEQVRAEYAWVPDDAFRAGRARILRAFLERPRLYQTPRFAERLEDAAHANLARSLRRLADPDATTAVH